VQSNNDWNVACAAAFPRGMQLFMTHASSAQSSAQIRIA
jgi:hypothetical protein